MTNESSSRDMGMESTGVFASIFFSYLITGLIGLNFHTVNTFATLIWAPSGIAFAAFLMYGYRVWPGVFFAAFLVNSYIGAPPHIALFIALGNTVGPFIFSFLVKRYNDYDPSVLRLRDNVAMIVSALLIPVITATVGVGSLWVGGELSLETITTTWSTWWVGDALGILIFAPFILKWFSQPLLKRTRAHHIDMFFILAVVVSMSFFIFWGPLTHFAYYLFIPFTWMALRAGPRGITLAILLSFIIALCGLLFNPSPSVSQDLLYLQIFFGTMTGVFLIFSAVIEERRHVLKMLGHHVTDLETALQKINSEDGAKKEFLAVLAHELRNPLATILSSIELIRLQGSSAPNTPVLLETIAERARVMVRLLDDLLDISHISQKNLSLQNVAISINRFIERLEHSILQLTHKHGHTLSITKSDDELFINADPVRLEQIVINLVTNAAKYTKNKGVIEILLQREKDVAVIRVRDSGVGIPKHMLTRIFEPFFQINKSQSREGLGIGLPLTRQLVEMHGGTIEAESGDTNAGSEFIVRLPLLRYTDQKERLSPTIPLVSHVTTRKPRHVKRTFKILIVDDNEDGNEALARLLELRGHTTAVAYNGSEAIQKALEFKPEIVLLDIGLPDIDGYEVASRLREQKKPHYLIALTGYGQTEDKERAKQAGFDYHLTKPASFKEIEAVVRKIPHTFGKHGA